MGVPGAHARGGGDLAALAKPLRLPRGGLAACSVASREDVGAEGDRWRAPDVKVEIESLEYNYEPGIVGPLVAYAARVQHQR